MNFENLFEPIRDIAGIILNRWGHAYVNPDLGFMFGQNNNLAPPDVIRQPYGLREGRRMGRLLASQTDCPQRCRCHMPLLRGSSRAHCRDLRACPHFRARSGASPA